MAKTAWTTSCGTGPAAGPTVRGDAKTDVSSSYPALTLSDWRTSVTSLSRFGVSPSKTAGT